MKETTNFEEQFDLYKDMNKNGKTPTEKNSLMEQYENVSSKKKEIEKTKRRLIVCGFLSVFAVGGFYIGVSSNIVLISIAAGGLVLPLSLFYFITSAFQIKRKDKEIKELSKELPL